jgi:hypothetical protein
MNFMNPNASDIRKLLIGLISKISSMENSKGYEPTSATYEEKVEAERNKSNANLLK